MSTYFKSLGRMDQHSCASNGYLDLRHFKLYVSETWPPLCYSFLSLTLLPPLPTLSLHPFKGWIVSDTASRYQLALLFRDGNSFTGGKGLNSNLNIYIEHSNEVNLLYISSILFSFLYSPPVFFLLLLLFCFFFKFYKYRFGMEISHSMAGMIRRHMMRYVC